MPKITRFATDHPRLVILLAVLSTGIFLSQFPKVHIDTDPENMLEEDQPDRVFYNEVKKIFRIHDLLVVGITDPRGIFRPDALERMDRIISQILLIEGVVVQDVVSLTTSNNPICEGKGHVIIDRVMREVPRTAKESEELFLQTVDNWCLDERLVSRDGKSIAIYIPIEKKDMSRRIGLEIESILERELLPDQTYHFAGLPIAEDTFGFEMFLQMGVVAPLAFMFIMLLVYLLFRQVIFLIPVGMDAMFSVIWAMGLLIATGNTVHIMSSMIPVFLMPIAILDDCHVLSEFFDRFRKLGDKKRALAEAMEELYRPMFQTSLTSAVGFGSLALTDIPPVRVFGIFVAFGIMAAWLFSMTVVPAVITLMKDDRLKKVLPAGTEEKAPYLDRILEPLGHLTFSKSKWVLLGTAVITGLAAVGLPAIEVNDNPVKWFKEGHRLRQADDFMNRNFGGTYMAYLVARGDEPGTFHSPEVVRYLERLQEHLEGEPTVGTTIGLPDPVKRLNQVLHDFDENYVRIPDTREAVGQFIFLAEIGGDPNDLATFIDRDRRTTLLWVQMKKGDNKYMQAVETRNAQFMAANPPPQGLSFQWSGLTYINKVWQDLMVTGMFKALLGAAGVVFLLMLLEFRSLILGILAMLPLTLAILITYGLVGWIGKEYDMPIAVCSTLTLGMAIDFAIHYLQRWRVGFRRLRDIEVTHVYMFGEPGRALLRNAIIISLGFLPLMFSHLSPYVTVGACFAILMLISMFTTLLIIPATLRYLGLRIMKGEIS